MAGCHSSGDSDPPTGPQLLFVYGTLMRGMANHRQLAGLACQGTAELAGFVLYDLGPFPMAIASGNPQQRLHGELYAMPPAQLQALDRFEGAPRLYQRQRHRLADGRSVWLYVGQPRQVRHVQRIADGRWIKPPPTNGPPGPAPAPGPTH
jgi:gamma-glutamylcyclotransferase (GGCT)/AIG2-like uncharacterized protein YtfP